MIVQQAQNALDFTESIRCPSLAIRQWYSLGSSLDYSWTHGCGYMQYPG